MPIEIRDRVKELVRVKCSDLIVNERNWRTHPEDQKTAMTAVLEEIGFAGAALVREVDDGYVLIDGHLRQDIEPEAIMPCLVLDVDENEANVILATYDPLSAMAEKDADKLHELLLDLNINTDALAEFANSLDEALPDFQPTDGDDQPQLDERSPITCPHCNRTFTP